MSTAPYRRVLGISGVRQALILGVLIRVPYFAAALVLTLHVVQDLGRSYGEAGLVTAVYTLGAAIANPWRGRLLDRRGLRRTITPSILISAAGWAIAPFVSYWVLLVMVFPLGLFMVPTFTIVRQAVLAAIADTDRKTGMALDSIFVELTFMGAPALGVWAATVWPTTMVLLVLQLLAVLACIALWWVNPVIATPTAEGQAAHAHLPLREWFTPSIFAVCLAGAATTLALAGSDIAFVAALREMNEMSSLGLVLAVWAGGSLLGGIVYGATHHQVGTYGLLAVLAITTVPIALSTSVPTMLILSFIAGLTCAPTIAASAELLSRLAPVAVRGEALGWHGSAMTLGTAMGAPVAGAAIDAWGWRAGFVAAGVCALAVAIIGAFIAAREDRADRAKRVTAGETLVHEPGGAA